jgi:serine/threonine protein kinase/Tfp pilus assembly protein PilF
LNCRSSEIIDDPRLCGERYCRGKLLGRGGIARIFLATDTITGQQVTLKIAHQADPEAAEVMRSEFRFGMIHRHPALVNPASLFENDGRPVIVMPFVKGISQDDLHSILESSGGERIMESIIIGILECAAFIHFCGYSYNDFKPSNFIWRQDYNEAAINPLLLDFNLVSAIGERNIKRGTIEYVAPEVLLGEMPSPASDLYSIGATLYELFSGYPPFKSDDGPSLIKEITENGILDLSPIPIPFKSGIKSLLAREPEARPRSARFAAEAFGLIKEFDNLADSRSSFYLTAGRPPFAVEIKKVLSENLARKSEKVLLIIGTGQGTTELDYLSSELSLNGYRIERLWKGYSTESANLILDHLLNKSGHDYYDKTVLVVDDLLLLNSDQRAKIRTLLRPPRFLPVIASGLRWTNIDLPCQIYDAKSNCSPHRATTEALSAFLKGKASQAYIEGLRLATGGDPELIFLRLLSSMRNGEYNLLAPDPSFDITINELQEINSVIERMLGQLDQSGRELLSILAAWDNEIPLILLTEFDEDRMALLDSLLAGGFLQRNKDSVGFPSSDCHKYIYSKIPPERIKQYHRFWALAAEKYLTDPDEQLEAMATHWGRSDNPQRGFEANLAAAKEFYERSELIKANLYAETLLELAEGGSGSLTIALMLSADILKQAGSYHEARGRYLTILRCLETDRDERLQAETFKDLGDLYRSTKRIRRALYYTGKALALFEKLGCEQGIADCHNNIGLISWVNQEYEKALQSFHSAFEVNQRLGNFIEQAKIQSNIGIIKDIMGKTSEVAGHFEMAYQDAQIAAAPRLEAPIANNLGYFYIRQNDLAKARHYLKRSLEISEKIGHMEGIINALSNLGLCDLKSGALFSSIDYCQRAIQAAEAVANKHLSFDAQLFLSEIGILMGNFSLADSVLRSLENDQIYLENKAFARQVDILRSRWHLATGDHEAARRLAIKAAEYADEVGDSRLNLEARLILFLASPTDPDLPRGLIEISERAAGLGHIDLADSATLALAQLYVLSNYHEAAETWLLKSISRSLPGRGMHLDSAITSGNLKTSRGQYDDAIRIFSETEVEAAANGYLPHALEASTNLAEVYILCGKLSRAQEILMRAEAYRQKMTSSLPGARARRSFAGLAIVCKLEKLQALTGEKVKV